MKRVVLNKPECEVVHINEVSNSKYYGLQIRNERYVFVEYEGALYPKILKEITREMRKDQFSFDYWVKNYSVFEFDTPEALFKWVLELEN